MELSQEEYDRRVREVAFQQALASGRQNRRLERVRVRTLELARATGTPRRTLMGSLMWILITGGRR